MSEENNVGQRQRDVAAGESAAQSSSTPDSPLSEAFKELRHWLTVSQNYYGALWTRCRYWLWTSRLFDFIVAACAGAAFWKDQGSWTGYVAIGIAAISWLKTESFVDRRVGVLAKQYRQVGRIINKLPKFPEEESRELYKELSGQFADVEDGDLPTIQCLFAICANETRKKFNLSGCWKLGWFQRYVGVYFRCIRCDEKLKFIEEGGEDGDKRAEAKDAGK